MPQVFDSGSQRRSLAQYAAAVDCRSAQQADPGV
jgi:hypothetical protein